MYTSSTRKVCADSEKSQTLLKNCLADDIPSDIVNGLKIDQRLVLSRFWSD